MEKNKDGEELDIHASQGAATTPITLLVIGEWCDLLSQVVDSEGSWVAWGMEMVLQLRVLKVGINSYQLNCSSSALPTVQIPEFPCIFPV